MQKAIRQNSCGCGGRLMPLFKAEASKSTPKKAIAYITRKDKATYVSVRNLFEDEDYAEQFRQTAARFGKGKKYEERKYYHFKLSCAQKDNVCAKEHQLYAEELAARLFPDCECVIATHTDTKTVHSHIIVNAITPITGKKLRILLPEYRKMKDEANRLGEELGYTKTEYRRRAEHSRTQDERHIILKGGTSWKEELRMVIEMAKQSSSTQEEFTAFLKDCGVTVTRSKTEYSFLHPQKEKAIRGLKLGENYCKEKIDEHITNNRRTDFIAVGKDTGNEQGETRGFRECALEGSISAVERELQRIDKQAEYAHQGLDYEREQVREQERLQRERAERERVACNHCNEELARRSEEIQRQNFNRTKSNSKADGNYASK